MPHARGMTFVEPIDSISRSEPTCIAPATTPRPETPAYATHASRCTAFDRYPCILDPAAASIAAAAAAQDMRTFWQGSARRKANGGGTSG